jgi:hypothetical protein
MNIFYNGMQKFAEKRHGMVLPKKKLLLKGIACVAF